MSLVTAKGLLPGAVKPWVEIVEAILMGKLVAIRLRGGDGANDTIVHLCSRARWIITFRK